MPDMRHLAIIGDVVKARWFDDPAWYAGIVQQDYADPRLFIYCPHRDTPEDGRTTDNYVTVGYLEDACEVQLMSQGC